MNRMRIAVLVVLIVGVSGVLIWRETGGFHQKKYPTHNARVTNVGLSPNRKIVWVEVKAYYSPSCTRMHVTMHRGKHQWVAGVAIVQIRSFCTMELAISPPLEKTSDGHLKVPNDQLDTNSAYVVSLQLDHPIPADVTVSY